MRNRNSISDRKIAARNRDIALSRFLRTATLVWKQTFQPVALGLLALSLSMILWGIGYKVSLFEHPTDSSGRHFPVAKAVIEQHRQDGGHTPASAERIRHRVKLQFELGTDGYINPLQSSTQVASIQAPLFSAHHRALPFFDSALPLRSPPAIVA